MSHRNLTNFDHLVIGLDQALRTVFGSPHLTERPNPAANEQEGDLSPEDQQHIARLMRINHTGEVCAQGLYQGQALTARLEEVRDSMERAAAEENDHLAWCESRIHELGDRKSLLNPFWYAGSFTMGAVAGLAGDKWSLGFVAETEHQVCDHLNDHLGQIPLYDRKSRAILEQMKVDEARHATKAQESGGAELPGPVKLGMKLTAKVMTKTTYWV